jgi:hypothetical protein
MLSCELNPDTVVVNKSIREVTFRYSKYDDLITLPPEGVTSTKYFFTDVYNLQPEKRVTQTRERSGSDNIITIDNIPAVVLEVKNYLPDPVTLTANGWMEPEASKVLAMDDPTPGTPGALESPTKIFTTTPGFTAVTTGDGFPVTVTWKYENNKILVTIQGSLSD